MADIDWGAGGGQGPFDEPKPEKDDGSGSPVYGGPGDMSVPTYPAPDFGASGEQPMGWPDETPVPASAGADATETSASFVSGVSDAAGSLADATADAASAAWNAIASAGQEIASDAVFIAATAPYAVGEEETAQAMRETSKDLSAASDADYRQASDDLTSAGEHLYGQDQNPNQN